MASLEQSRTKLAGEADLVQKKAFTKWINSHLEKAGLEVKDLFEDLRDGSMLLTLLELFTGKKLPKEKGKMRVHHIQNVKTAINYLTDVRKIRIVGIPNEEIIDGNRKLTLGLIWMLILNFELSGALSVGTVPSQPGQRPKSPKEVSAKEVKKELLEWAQQATVGYDEVSITNFHKSWNDGLAFCAIINRHRPDLLDYDDCDPSKPLENFEKAFSIAEKELGVIRFLDPEDVNVEKPSEEAVLIYVSALRQVFPEMPPPHRRKGPPVSLEDYNTLYTSLQEWISKRRDLVTKKDIPTSIDELRQLLEEFMALRSEEDKVKEKEKDELKGMEVELKLFAMKRRKEMDIPDSKDIEELFSTAMKESDDYQLLLQSELNKLVKQDELVKQVLDDINKASNSLDEIEEAMNVLEKESVAMETEDVSETVASINSKIKGVEAIIESVEKGLNTLKDMNYHDAPELEKQLQSLQSRVSSLYSRLQQFMSSVDEAELLLAEADTKLKECEKWLIINGKFAENQLIVDQMNEYKLFQENQLADATSIMDKVNSAPLIGMEGRVEDLNKRWSLIQEQFNNRLSKLENITDTVSKFDTLKTPLEEWCVKQQEVIHQLPLLETDLSQLTSQKEHFETILADILNQKETVEKIDSLSDQFLHDREPVQASADKFARRLKRLSSEFSIAAVRMGAESSDDGSGLEMSLCEQSEVLKDQWERYKVHVETRVQQATDLMERLSQFNKLHTQLRELINEGRSLLESERPVGDSAERIEEQTNTCQLFNKRLTDTQPTVDTMLSLGRSIIGEHYTNPHHDYLSQVLTQFIQDWSNLLLSWQNWYDELHATGEQSQSLSEQFDKLKQFINDIIPESSQLFPANVTIDTLLTDLKELQETFNKTVYDPLVSLRPTFTSLSSNVHLLPNKNEVELVLKQFNELSDKFQSQANELSEVIDNVSCWWAEFEAVKSKIAEMREELTEARPLGGSVPIVNKQDEKIQDTLLQVEERRPKLLRCVRNLTSLANHTSLIVPTPLIECKEELQSDWAELHQQVEERRDRVEIGRVRLNVYIECRDPFDAWLKGAESKLLLWKRVDVGGKGLLIEQTESLKAFKTDIELHSHDLESCSTLADKFLDTAKVYQANLLSYKQKLHPPHTQSQLMPEGFYDWEEGEGLKGVALNEAVLQSEEYRNGLLVVRSDLANEAKRYHRLKGRVYRRTLRYEEARDKRIAVEEALEAIKPKLKGAESLATEIRESGLGKNSLKSLREQLEMMESLESEFSELRYLMDPLHMSVAAWSVREPVDSEKEEEEDEEGEEGDECVKEKEQVQVRYEKVQEDLRCLREELESSLAEAQAFQSAYSSFVSWLRDTERKIQRDNQLKLEINDLKSGLAYLKAVSTDIHSHESVYKDLCGRFNTVLEIMKGEERGETEGKLDNLVTRWTGLQVINEDIDVISEIIPQLEAFYNAQRQLVLETEELLEKLNNYSPSAYTSEGAEKKREELMVLSSTYADLQSRFDTLLLDSAPLTDTLFDQRRFQSDVTLTRDKLNECRIIKDDKNKTLKHITNKLKALEVSRSEYDTWLTCTEERMNTLDTSLGRSNVNEQLKEVQEIQADITEHEESLDSLENLSSSLSVYLDQHHMTELDTDFKCINSRYRLVSFSAQAFPLEAWLRARVSELYFMKKAAILVLPLTTQLHEVTRFQNQVEAHHPHITELEGVISSLPEQSDVGVAKVKLDSISKEYGTLKQLGERRVLLITSFLPRVKLYEGSLENWEGLLTGWEESIAALAPPTATPILIQSQIETIKSYLSEVSDHEPEFSALLREALQLYSGPEGEEGLIEELKVVCPSVSPLPPDDTRQGQTELQTRLDEDKQRLDSLKRSLSQRLSLLSSLFKDINSFNQSYSQLMPWVEEQCTVVGEGLIIKEPSHSSLLEKLNKCQAIQTLLVQKTPQKDELLQLYQTISSAVTSEDGPALSLKDQSDSLQTKWNKLSDQLLTAQTSLEPAVKLARSYEREKERVGGWINTALQELTQLGPIPSEPDTVQELKIRMDSLKAEYNSYAPLLAQCTEEGLGLSNYVQDPSNKEQLVKSIEDLQSGWNNVGTLLADIHQRLTDALMATQQFQQVADNLERWVNATQSSLKSLEPVGARVRLIEPQMEGFKPILEDIKLNQETLEQAKVIGSKVTVDTTSEEKLKVEKRLHALETRFYGLDKIGRGRMNELKDAHSKATSYESKCTLLANELKVLEERRGSFQATPIRSQPLRALNEELKSFKEVLLSSLQPSLNDMNTSECTLFSTDLPTITQYDNQDDLHLVIASSSPHRRSDSPLPPPESDMPTHPDFVKRPGAVEAIEIGSKLRKRHDKLKSDISRLNDEVEQLLVDVVDYEGKMDKFNKWLKEEKDKLMNINQLSVTSQELKQRLKELEDIQSDIDQNQSTLEKLNSTGTSLVDGCRDDLSRDSVRESLAQVNEDWGDLLKEVEEKVQKTKDVISLAEKYEKRESELETWLSECEEKLAAPTGGLDERLITLKEIQSDITTKSQLVQSTVTLGQNLESLLQNGKEETPLNYNQLKERYDNLSVLLEEKRKEIEESLTKATDLKSQIMKLCDQLRALKTNLDNHEPPRLIPDLIRQQIQELEVISSQFEALQPSVSECLVNGQKYNESDITALVNELSSCNGDVRTPLEARKSRLEGVLNTSLQFEMEHKEMSGWINGVSTQLGQEGKPRGTVDGVRVQIEEMEYTNSDIGHHQQPLQHLMNLGRGMMGGASPNDCVLVGDRLAQVQSNIETLQRHAYGRMRTLKEGLKIAESFSSCYQTTVEVVKSKLNDLSVQAPVGTDIDTVKGQLDDFKEFEEELQELKPHLSLCQTKAKELKGVCHSDDHPWVDAKLQDLSTLWSQLQSSCVNRQQQLDNALLRLGQFHETLGELLAWIQESINQLNEKTHPGVTVENIETLTKEVQALQAEVVAREPTVTSLNEAGKKLIAISTSAQDANDIERDVNTLDKQWSTVKSLSADKHLQLSTAHERARCFHGNWKEIVDKLNELEEQVLQEWKPHGLPISCQEDIESHNEFSKSVQSLRQPLDDLKSEGEGLKLQGSQLDCEMIDRWIGDLEKRWEEVVVAVEEKQSLLVDAKKDADDFESSFTNRSDELNQLETKAKESTTIQSEAEAVKQQLEAHNEFLKSLHSLDNSLKELETSGSSLAKGCVHDDGVIIRDKLQQLRSHVDSIQSDSLSHRSKLEEALLTLGEFEEAYLELKGWLANMNDQLLSPDPLTGQLESLSGQLTKHKVAQRELDARATNYKSVVKAGKELMKTKQGNDKNVLKRKLAELEEEWQGVCQLSQGRQKKIEDALKKVQLLQSQIQPLSSWMSKVLPSLDDSEPVHGDVATVHELIDTHEAFQEELGAHQKNIDSIEQEGAELVPHPLDDPSPLKEEIDELLACWSDICELSLKKQERLQEAKRGALEFSQGVRELWSWLEEKEIELDMMSPPADEVSMIQEQTEELEAFKSIVSTEQPHYEQIIEQGTNLHQLSHPRAEPILEGQLTQLQQKWAGLKTKISSRSEALASNMLEVHGLQDMLEQLSDWVQGAEDSMGEAEGVPIGDELDSVEQQLAEHEAFQEDMATLQPNMDALNKAARRRKARPSITTSSTSSHPDMTKRITHLYKRWQKLWLRSSERHRQLLEARTRLKDIAMARSFNFEAWCKRFVSWIDQQKLRVSDLFRRFDSNHDGMLTREEFMKGLKASGLAMNQIEMEKIADTFDRNKNGLIDLSEIMAILKGQRPRQKFTTSAGPARQLSDADKIDMEIQEQVAKCHCLHKFQVVRVGEGQYRFGDSQKLRMVRILRSTVMVRVGGGWEPLPEFLSKNDPCRSTGRTNAELRDLLTTDKQGVTSIEFRRKSQTAINAKNEAIKRASAKDTTSTSRAPHSGRQETVLTTKRGAPATAKVDTGIRQIRSNRSGSTTVTSKQSTGPDKVSPPRSKTPSSGKVLSNPQSSPERATPTATPGTPTRTPSTSKIPLPSGTSKIPISKIPAPSKGKTPRH